MGKAGSRRVIDRLVFYIRTPSHGTVDRPGDVWFCNICISHFLRSVYDSREFLLQHIDHECV